MALYIDADNISYQCIPDMINYINSINKELYIKKIYCDWSKTESKNCSKILNLYGLEPIQCFRIGKKQSTDIKLITDVINDINTFNNINDIFIATSDIDFTYLCQSLKKHGKHITLFTLQKTNLINYVDNVVNLKENNTKDTDIGDIIYNEIDSILSFKKLKEKLFDNYNLDINIDNILKNIDCKDYFFIKKKNKFKYIINLDKISNISNFENTDLYNKLKNTMKNEEFSKLIKLIS